MTVKELRELLKDAPDNMKVYVLGATNIYSYMFKEACTDESGVFEFAPPEEGEIKMSGSGFCILPHGFSDEDLSCDFN